jgi:hypothetical protein
MNRFPFVLSSIAVAVLAGCASESRITPAPAPVVVVAPAPAPYVVAPAGTVVVPQVSTASTVVVAPAALALRSGFGRIESILAIPNAAAGGAASYNRRIVMRMEDGSVQYFDTAATGLTVGDRIEITSDGTMRHPA